MPVITLKKNQSIDIEGTTHIVRGKPAEDSINLENMTTGEMVRHTAKGLSAMISAGKAFINTIGRAGNENVALMDDKLSRHFEGLSSIERDQAERRLKYVQLIEDAMPIPKTKDRLVPLIADFVKDNYDPNPPSFATVCRWHHDYQLGQGDPRALAPMISRRGNRTSTLDSDVDRIIEDAIDARYLTKERDSIRSVYDYVISEIERHNSRKKTNLSVPSIETVRRRIKQRNPFEVHAARHGKASAERLFNLFGQGASAQRVLERVEIDHTILDLMVVDDRLSLMLGRPTLTMAIDYYSRMILGYYVGFEPPGWQSVLHCLRHMIEPKDYVSDLYPEIRNSWPCAGIPENIVVDNGKEFHSNNFRLTSKQLSMGVIYTPRANPWFKGAVERLFGTMNSQVLSGVPGRTFANILKKGDYDPREYALVTLEQFNEALTTWIVDAYAQDYHEGMQGVPYEAWTQSQSVNPSIRLPMSEKETQFLVASYGKRTITRQGIKRDHLFYKSKELQNLRTALYKGKNPEVEIRYDPSCLEFIWVKTPSGEMLRVPAEDQSYACGLHVAQHKIILKYRAHLKREKSRDVSLVEARERIRDLLTEARRTGLRAVNSKRAARYEGIGSDKLNSPQRQDEETQTQVLEDYSEEESTWDEQYYENTEIDDYEEEDDYVCIADSNECYPE